MSGVQFGLVLKKKPGPAKPKPAASRPMGGRNAFGDHSSDEDNLDSDNDNNNKSSRPSSSSSTAAVNKTLRPYATATLQTSAVIEQQNEALAQDATVFDYDGVYDQLKAKDRVAELARKKDALDRKPKYVTALLQAAETRKRDRQIAEEKKIEREREQEGEEFKDKEKFITPAYKAQKEAMRLAEEEDRKREEMLSQDKDGSLMQGFYKTMLDQRTKLLRPEDSDDSSSKRLSREEAEALEQELKAKEKDDRILAEEARQRGLNVVLNEEGKIVDKRDLLKGGLNITKKPTASIPSSSSRPGDRRGDRYDDRRGDRRGGDSSRSSGGYDRERAYADYKDQKYRSSRDGDSRSSRDSAPDQRSRMTEQIERQLLEQEKKREEEEKQRQESIREALKRKNEEGEVMDAKARYLARKKAAAASGSDKATS
ncbi:coiled-coil domain-containing protein 55 [Entomortierella parvispora]|uniref:Coiled-coil domain-containing protein 55 n=1 Tax=Entomortierella parvispora TaxID=205924 RepID=A0A9P3HGC4_9FUNG|nr:coiled-coil domain-containing protein 55 [Entomortierella parvispora]